MTLAPILLASLLGQNCPAPTSASGPPPCAAANVPGCLPGYVPRTDEHGRTVYACDPNYRSPQAYAPAPPPPAPQQYAMAPPPASPWGYYPPPPVAQPVPVAPPAEPRGQVALVFMPGVSAYPKYTTFDHSDALGQLALEIRGVQGGARLRFLGEYASFGRLGEIGVKYDFFEALPVRPFIGLGGGVAVINPDPTLRASFSASAGVDFYLSRDFFLTGEINGRLFTGGTNGPAHGLVISDLREFSMLAGMGFYF